ncbi:MAG: immune inhibitor A [Anaerolineales bacterium]|nr:immune inhibitor A [Anaerolineales bacterium]
MSQKTTFITGSLLAVTLLFCLAAILLGAPRVARLANVPAAATTSPATPTIVPTLTLSPTAVSNTPTPTSTPLVAPQIEPTAAGIGTTGQASPLQPATEQLLLETILPARDQRLLAMRLKHAGREIPEIVKKTAVPYQLGDSDTFWVTDSSQTPPRVFQAKATLRYITAHSYWWVADGYNVLEADLQRSAEQFEKHTYPTNRAFFGSEWSPGVDGDVRVHIFMGDLPGVAGFFYAANEYSRLAEPYSNEREMFFMNLQSVPPGSAYFDSVLAHEFQHMIHFAQDRNEDAWVNEGMSELAAFINGYGPSSFSNIFSGATDTQLTSWASPPSAAVVNYGGSFRFMAYFLQRYGEEMTQAVVANPNNGIAGFNAVLAEHGQREQFNEVFADFVVANYLNDATIGDGRWGYTDFSPEPVGVAEHHSVYPAEGQTTVYQYGTDYIELSGAGKVTIDFTGATEVKVVNNDAYSGQYQWYSLRGDDSNTRLTRAFDLRHVSSATLNYATWYDIETDWDYGYVEISSDGGETWTILQAPHSITTNPSGNAYGPGYTGLAGEGPAWLDESLDISAYAGQEVVIRFEYVTDDAVNRSGWTLDDIRIPEIDFYDDVESGPNGWQAEGFVRMDNILPQHFLVQVLEMGDTVNLRQIPLDVDNHGVLTLEGLGTTLDRAVLMISGLTPVTTQPASYEYKLSP